MKKQSGSSETISSRIIRWLGFAWLRMNLPVKISPSMWKNSTTSSRMVFQNAMKTAISEMCIRDRRRCSG